MAKRIMRTFDRIDLSEYVVPGETDTLSLDGLSEMLFVVSNRMRAKWAFARVSREEGDPGVFFLHFEKWHSDGTE